MTSFIYELVVIVSMLTVNAVFAAYEMALASVPRVKLTVLLNQKKKGAAEAVFMKDRMEASLAVIQLGITLAGVIAAATGGAGVIESLAPYLKTSFGLSAPWSEVVAIVCLVIPLSGFTIIFAELIPKMFALNNKEWVCLTLSPAMKLLSLVAYPAVAIFENVVKRVIAFVARWKPTVATDEAASLHELKAATSLARSSKLIGAREEKIVLAAAQFSMRSVADIMLPVADISMIPISSTLSEALIKAHMDMHTRFPVCTREGDPETIEGYINFKDIVNALKLNPNDPSVRGITRPLKTVAARTSLSEALEQMIREKIHIALVSSEHRRVEGMITFEDIIEELVGEVEDEYDRLPTYIYTYGASWLVGGGASLSLVATAIGTGFTDAEKNETTAFAEWCEKKMGRHLKGGEIFNVGNLNITVRKLRRKRIAEAILSVRA